MERQEPTIGKRPELDEIEFRPRTYRGPTQRHTSNDTDIWIKASIGLVVVVLIAMGLIEWNARRQAAAMTAELTRPMTPKEEAQFKAQTKKWQREMEAESAAELAQVQRTLWQDTPRRPAYAPNPLRAGERCIRGDRFRRLANGWAQVYNDPC